MDNIFRLSIQIPVPLTSSMSPTNATNIHIRLVLEDIQQLRDKITKTMLTNVTNEGLKRNGKRKMV